jgi:hypothetical protein
MGIFNRQFFIVQPQNNPFKLEFSTAKVESQMLDSAEKAQLGFYTLNEIGFIN